MTVQACCQPYHASEMVASEAEALMRARFSAYVKKDAKFLVSHSGLARFGRTPCCSAPLCTGLTCGSCELHSSLCSMLVSLTSVSVYGG